MSKSKRILIFSVSVGTGHTRAAEAVKIAMQEKYPGSEVKIIDTFQSASPFLGKIIFGSYLFWIKRMPLLYRQVYNRADEGKKFSKFSKGKFNYIIKKFTGEKILSLIDSFNPDIIICTHPFAMGILSYLKEEKRVSKPIVAVITDFIIHPYWLYKNVDTYFVAVEEQKEGLVDLGINANKVKVTGIPIHPHFNQGINKDKVKQKLAIDCGLPTVLIMGGGLGLGPVGKIVKFLADNQIPVQLLVVVGKNQKLRQQMEELVGKTNALKLRVFGFVENVHELMGISDLFVTKPGGLTVAEALAKGLPMLLTKPIPGHEEKNAEYLIKAGAAFDARDEKILLEILNRCIKHPEQIKLLSKKALAIGNASSAYAVANCLAEMGEKQIEELELTI